MRVVTRLLMRGVTAARLAALAALAAPLLPARAQEWPVFGGDPGGMRYSPLTAIDRGNVGTLQVAWTWATGEVPIPATDSTKAARPGTFQATPLMINDTLYLSTPYNRVVALDAGTGRELWSYDPGAYRAGQPSNGTGFVHRGVAAWSDGRGRRQIFINSRWRLIALDAATGRLVWDKVFADVRASESATAAPLVVKNLVLIGASGGEYGVRGHIDAFDMNSGSRAWRTYTIPKPGEQGSESWGAGDSWARGGGTTWITGTYDPELDLVYWGTGNPGPDFNDSQRPGDNLYSNSVLALDATTGAIRWHYQWTPHDLWDYDGVGENILFEQGGRKLLAHFDKNGHLFILDRTNGQLVRAAKFTETTWGDVDPGTGRITVKLRPTEQGVEIKPSPSGGKDGFPHAAYSRQTGLLYVPTLPSDLRRAPPPSRGRRTRGDWRGISCSAAWPTRLSPRSSRPPERASCTHRSLITARPHRAISFPGRRH